MKKADMTYILGIVFAAATSLFYCCTMWFGLQLPRYYPLEHAWKWVNETGVPSQAWYAKQAFAFIGGGLATLIVYFVFKYTGLKQADLKPGWTRWLAVGAIVLIVVCMACILHHEYSKWGVFKALLS
ncbi:MAG: hypothetical protein A2Z25_02515 [Planctomycetes bacterium RBG_16_55_9]|nr:MAG: hypothetical protein A2Z25_02515 [Planctomycetes bacterium RBG_16_55_9]